ncbi:hypothetical protein BFJ69_g625 [Fusarium oxysporum]|uniref:Uncharacterized protein n=1 Tax=Fusarium oxysporum TaxID=5507 RepID=A0A420P3N3_FUSOX|nr:hypothetical protein BFJ69_g625 [Fusarium oxysporum]
MQKRAFHSIIAFTALSPAMKAATLRQLEEQAPPSGKGSAIATTVQ